MSEYKGSVCALGDMNTIEGNINDSIRQSIENTDYKLVLNNTLTFFGAFYDTIPKTSDSLFLLDVTDEQKYNLLFSQHMD